MAGGWSANLHVYEIHQSLGMNILGVGGEEATRTCRLKFYSKVSVRVRDYNSECRWSFWRRNRLMYISKK